MEKRAMTEFIQDHKEIEKEYFINYFNDHNVIKNPKSFFNELVQRGVFHKQKDGSYSVPMPSMRTWMIEQFGNIKGRLTQPNKDSIKKGKQ
ncbi:MAG: hypothetical protein OXC67_02415 [Flavobacteriaceae bacterium]|nr:hypothetical protein [Flavobacteriaceae bacterium]MCY4297738.1 hypothetical protein [Flavobacteriaceae bacterium]